MKQEAQHTLMSPHELGVWGERHAEEYLQSQGYIILARNWHGHGGELDRIVFDPTRQAIVAVEVKTRRISASGHVRAGMPEESVTPIKMKRIRSLIIQWIRYSRIVCERVGIDVVGILVADGDYHIRHVKDVA